MQKIPLPLAEPDMVLEKPVTRDNGMILVGQGTVLTESLIARLKNMNIASVVVQGHPLDLGSGGAGTSMGRRRERLEHLFRHVDQDPFMHGMRMFLDDYFARKGALEGMAPPADNGEEG
jgi:hypothetical protein